MEIVDTVEAVNAFIARARKSRFIAVGTGNHSRRRGAPPIITPLRANLVSISIAVAPGESFYLPFAHRQREPAQGDLLLGASPKTSEKAAASSIAALAREGSMRYGIFRRSCRRTWSRSARSSPTKKSTKPRTTRNTNYSCCDAPVSGSRNRF